MSSHLLKALLRRDINITQRPEALIFSREDDIRMLYAFGRMILYCDKADLI